MMSVRLRPYRRAAAQSSDVKTRKLLGDLALIEASEQHAQSLVDIHLDESTL